MALCGLKTTTVNIGEYAKNPGAEDGVEYKTQNQYKLFYEGEDEDNDAEIYLNINPTAIIKFFKK